MRGALLKELGASTRTFLAEGTRQNEHESARSWPHARLEAALQRNDSLEESVEVTTDQLSATTERLDSVLMEASELRNRLADAVDQNECLTQRSSAERLKLEMKLEACALWVHGLGNILCLVGVFLCSPLSRWTKQTPPMCCASIRLKFDSSGHLVSSAERHGCWPHAGLRVLT